MSHHCLLYVAMFVWVCVDPVFVVCWESCLSVGNGGGRGSRRCGVCIKKFSVEVEKTSKQFQDAPSIRGSTIIMQGTSVSVYIYSVLSGSILLGVGVAMLPVATRRSGEAESGPHIVTSDPIPLVITTFSAWSGHCMWCIGFLHRAPRPILKSLLASNVLQKENQLHNSLIWQNQN
jgi:hypothetical protein